MTRRESAIISLYTGMLCGPFDALVEYGESLLGHAIFTHQFSDEKFVEKLKKLAENDFKDLCEGVPK